MLDVVTSLFTRRNPRRDAENALARIMNRFDMNRMEYDSGISSDRRVRNERNVAMGVWLFPCDEGESGGSLDVQAGLPAVTHDLRNDGFGVLTPIALDHQHFAVAAFDEHWQFFRCVVRHNTQKPGGWYHLGMEVERTLKLDSEQLKAFRVHVESIQQAQAIVAAEPAIAAAKLRQHIAAGVARRSKARPSIATKWRQRKQALPPVRVQRWLPAD